MAKHDHEHAHLDAAGLRDARATRALRIAFAITATFFIVEVIGAVASGSLALAADAAHMFSDVIALGIALIADQLMRRPASRTHSYGWRRAEVMAAQFNGLLLLGVSAWIVVEAISRLEESVAVDSAPMMLVAAVGLLANLASAAVLQSASAQNMNVRAAVLHTLSDAAGSLGALIAGAAILVWNFDKADSIASIAIAALVVVAALQLLSDSTHVLLEATPKHLDLEDIESALRSHESVLAVHHLHVWSLAPQELALSAHVEVEGKATLHEAQAAGAELKAMLQEQFGVGHSTLELECHPCEPDEQSH